MMMPSNPPHDRPYPAASNVVGGIHQQSSVLPNSIRKHLLHDNAIAGALAGATTSVLLAPLDIVKTRLQVQRRSHNGQLKYKGTFDIFRVMSREEGIRGFYKGLTPTLAGLIPNWAIYFTCYDYFKSKFASTFESHPNGMPSLPQHILSSVLSGAITQTITSPIWVVRTRFQTAVSGGKYVGVVHALTTIVREEGVRSLYRGLIPSYLGLSHVAVQFPLYEFLRWWFIRNEVLTTKSSDQQYPNAAQVIVASTLSKIVACVVGYPHEVLRSRLQDNGHATQLNAGKYSHHASILKMVRLMFQEEGIAAFYKGLAPNLLRVTPAACVTFMTYEFTIKWLRRLREQESSISPS